MTTVTSTIMRPFKDKPLRSRIGKFRITWTPLIEELLQNEHPESALAAWNAMMQDLIITRAENDFVMNQILYTALHPAFDSQPEGCVIPEYSAVIQRQIVDHGITTFTCTWRKVA